MSDNDVNLPHCEWVYFATPKKGRGRTAFKALIQDLRIILCHAYNSVGIPLPNVLQLRSRQKVLLVYRGSGERAYRPLFCCTLGSPKKPLNTDRQSFEVFSIVDPSMTARLGRERFDPDPILGKFVGITISDLHDLEGNDSEILKPKGQTTLRHWNDVFRSPDEPRGETHSLLPAPETSTSGRETPILEDVDLTTEDQRIILGFDPGGKSGVALLRAGGNEPPSLRWGTVASVDAAVDWYLVHLNGSIPTGIGIDAPLSWETGPCGWRGPDFWLKRHYPAVAGSVVSTNSAYGAMAVQGIALALRLSRRIEKALALNETHPKVLYYALSGATYPKDLLMPAAVSDWLFSRMGISAVEPGPITTDEWDAMISAWATCQGLSGCWKHDLVGSSPDTLFPAGSATYFWPE